MPRNPDKQAELEEREIQGDRGGLDIEDPKNAGDDDDTVESDRVRNAVTDETDEEELAEEDLDELADDDLGKMEGPDA